MALNRYACSLIAKYVPGASILSLGHPDLLITSEDCHAIFGRYPKEHVDAGARHGINHPLPEVHGLFTALGGMLKCVDHDKTRGCEAFIDLNTTVSDGQTYDIVLDPGTTEHCFNVSQALMNAANAVKPGGRILHVSPMTMVNHGFYNYSPTLFQDFYEQNGWEVELLQARDGVGTGRVVFMDPTKRFHAPSECVLYCMAKRPSGERTSGEALKFPVQTKYLKGEAGML